MSWSTPRKLIKDMKKVMVKMTSEDGALHVKVDLLDAMKEHIDPGSFSWHEMKIMMESYPSSVPYLEVDRTTMPNTRPCLGSLPLTAYRPDGKQAHFGIAGFLDLKDNHHNIEYWWKDFEGKEGFSKKVEGHDIFDITKDVTLSAEYDDKIYEMTFQGKKTEKIVPSKKRRPQAKNRVCFKKCFGSCIFCSHHTRALKGL